MYFSLYVNHCLVTKIVLCLLPAFLMVFVRVCFQGITIQYEYSLHVACEASMEQCELVINTHINVGINTNCE